MHSAASNTNSNTNSNTDSNSNTNTNTDSDSNTYTSFPSPTFTFSLKDFKLSRKLWASNLLGRISIYSCSCQQQNRLQSTQYFRPRW